MNSKPRLLEGAADRLCRLGLRQTAGSQGDRRLTQSTILYAFCARRRPKWGRSRIDSFLRFGMRLATTARAQRLAATALIRNREEQGCENE